MMITDECDDMTEVLDSSCKSRDSSCSSAEKATVLSSEQNVMILVRDGTQGKEEWYLDSGCSTHMTGRRDWFVQINQVVKNKVKFAEDSTLMAEGVGDVLIEKKDGGHSMIKDVLYIPGIKCNLLSIGQLLEKGCNIRLEDKILRFVDASGVLILKAPMATNRTFKVELKVLEHRCLATAASREEWLWHYRLGHLNFCDLKALQQEGMVTGLPHINVPAELCEECVKGKQHKGSFSKDAGHRTNAHLEVVYSDVCGPMQVDTLGGNRYFVTFIDDFSRKLWTYVIKRKDEVFDVFKRFKSMAERQCGRKLKILKTDGGGEYTSVAFGKYCDDEGIVREVVPPYTPQQNGAAERKNRTIMNMVRSMLCGKKLPKELWGEAVSTATYLLNRCPTKKLEKITPE